MATVIKDSCAPRMAAGAATQTSVIVTEVVATCKPPPPPPHPSPNMSLREMLRSQLMSFSGKIEPYDIIDVIIPQCPIYLPSVATSDSRSPLICNRVFPCGNGTTRVKIQNTTDAARDYELSWI